MKKYLIIAGIVILGAAIVGGYFYPKFSAPAGSTTVGGTFNSAKIAAISFNPTTATATSTGILNPAGQDVYVTSNFIDCSSATTSYTAYTGAGLANWTFKAATSSTAAPNTNGNTNLVMNTNIATSTGTAVAGTAGFGVITYASSTAPVLGNGPQGFNYLWAAGTYMNFWSNATNTAQCVVGVSYISS